MRSRAIFFILGLAAANVAGVVYLFNVSNNKNIELITRSCVRHAQLAFKDLEKNTENMLSAALETLLSNEEIARVFSSGDRDRLYRVVHPLFEKLKRQNNITHWYFLDPEPAKTCFLRIHAPHIYNDVITRATLDRCVETKKFAFGKELGKTALALRAVHPYKYGGQLIGYMELAVQVEEFFQALKQQTGNEYGLLVKKKYLDRVKWASVTNEKGTRDNWDDMEHLLLVNATCQCIHWKNFQKRLEDIEHIPEEGLVLEKVSSGKEHFVRAIFPFYDAAGRKAGGVFVVKNITPIYAAMQNQKREILTMILGFLSLITFFMIFFHKRAEKELRKYRGRLEEMVKEKTAELVTANERLNREIQEHKDARRALLQEGQAREEAEKKQIEAVKHAEQSARMASIGVMAASITHEINQPLNAIKVTADSIQYWHKRNPGRLPEPFTGQLDIISRSVTRIVEIIQHMRTFWVIPNTPQAEETDVNKAVQEALSLTRQQLHAHGIREQLDMAPGALVIKGNLVHVEQIIVNLVVNAINALDEKEQENKEIGISTFARGGFAVLTVVDNGPGLPTDDMDRLFDPFFSTHNGGEGMGLGLAIVKRYIDQYNGIIEAVTNKDGGGACFTVKFPLYNSRKAADV
jgi:signal transduction histidine kinase